MISPVHAALLGLLQGISELFPVSSLGHSVIFPRLVGWQIDQHDPSFLTFLVGTHLATATVLFLFFWDDWVQIIRGLLRSIARGQIPGTDPKGRLGWLLIAGTIPAGLLGLLLQHRLREIFASASVAAFFLIVNGLLLALAELLRRRAAISDRTEPNPDNRIGRMRFTQALGVGLAQALALIPGLSRSGATMGGGLLVGLSHEDSARFSFLLATPIIGAAALLKLPSLLLPENQPLLLPTAIGALCAALTAYFSVRFLMRYFHTNTLTPFAVYCAIAGILATLQFWVG